MENLYEILEVSKNASPEVIDKAYKTLAKKYHPDVSQDKEKAEKMMIKLNSAYEILSNPKTREEYDYNLQQEEKVEKVNINKEVENKIRYNNYYNENIQTNNYNQNVYDDINIYNNNNFQPEDDYANNFNLFSRIQNLRLSKNEKIFLTIIFFIILFLIIKFFTMITDFLFPIDKEENPSDKQQVSIIEEKEYPINDTTAVELVNDMFVYLKEYDLNGLNEHLTEYTKISKINIEELNNDKEIYQYILNNSEYIIKDYNITNKKAQITVIVDTFDVSAATKQYSEWVSDNYDDILFNNGFTYEAMKEFQENYNKAMEEINKQHVEKVLYYLNQNIDKKQSREIIIVVDNTQKGWKINFNFQDIFGTSIL